MESVSEKEFKRKYQAHLKHLKLKGLQPKTIEAYARAIRRIGTRFEHRIDDLSEQQLTDYFAELLTSHSWSAVKLDLYGLKFYYTYVLGKPWVAIDLIKPPKTRRLPNILSVEEAARLFQHTRTASYRVFYFTLYSLGLRLGEGLRLQVGDIDAARQRVHVRYAKATRIVSCRCHGQRCYCCVASGNCIAIHSYCFPLARADRRRPAGPPPHWIAVACKTPCAGWRSSVG